MTENERDAGDDMAKLLEKVAAFFSAAQIRLWPEELRAAIKAWEDAKNEDA